jgi:hypothetical protein
MKNPLLNIKGNLIKVNRGVGSIKRLGGGGTGFQGHFWILKRVPKKFSRHTIAELHVF